jgi:GAF domain-containing protein
VVGTRLPYRGTIPDDPSRQFLATVLIVCPPEILLVPVTVRERVVGVLFAENRTRHTFDDQLAFASRAAGMALERVLKAKRS